jgi:signal transduction histidine kinase
VFQRSPQPAAPATDPPDAGPAPDSRAAAAPGPRAPQGPPPRDRRAADRRLAAVVEGMSDAFLALDAEWRVTYANQECARLNQTTPEALVGCDHWARWPETAGTEVEREYRRAVAEGVPARFTHYYPGVDAWHEVHAYPSGDGGLSVFYRDVTAERRAEAERERLLAAEQAARADAERARRAAERLQATTAALTAALTPDQVSAVVAEAARDALGVEAAAVATVSPDGRTLHYRAALGYPEPFTRASDTMALADAAPLPAAARTGAPVYLESQADWDLGYPALGAAHRAFGFEAAAALPFATDGRVLGGLVLSARGPRRFTADERALLLAISQQGAAAFERAALYAAAEAARAEAERANRAKAEFLAVMSHELRTPLNAIGGYAELLDLGLYGPVTPEQRATLARVQHSQRHLLGLINGVLNYSRVEAGAVRYEIGDVPLGEAVDEAEALVAPQLRAKGLRLARGGRAAAAAGRPLAARADRDKLQQILLNLLSNAVKFTNARPGLAGEVAVECEAAADAAGRPVVRVRVRDTGVGIPADKLAAVFEPFVQVDARLTRTQEGTGLGLAISRDLARGMAGDITAESTPGVGSVFTLTLPRAGA